MVFARRCHAHNVFRFHRFSKILHEHLILSMNILELVIKLPYSANVADILEALDDLAVGSAPSVNEAPTGLTLPKP